MISKLAGENCAALVVRAFYARQHHDPTHLGRMDAWLLKTIGKLVEIDFTWTTIVKIDFGVLGYIYIYMYVYTYMYVYIDMCVFKNIYICICKYVNVDVNISKYVCIYIYTFTLMYIYICMYVCRYIYICRYVYIYGVISKFLYPDSDEKHVHCVFTGLRLISSIAPTNLKIWEKNMWMPNFHQNLAHVASAGFF